MYIDRVQQKVKGKVYTRVLLRHSVRVGKKVVHHTIANLSHCAPEDLTALEVALRHKQALAALHELASDALEVRQGASIGAVYLLHKVAQRTGITAALGNSLDRHEVLWQVLVRTLVQGSCLSHLLKITWTPTWPDWRRSNITVSSGCIGTHRARGGRKLDDCHALHSNVSAAHMDAATIRARYKDMAQVEAAFCTLKTAHLDERPVYVWCEERTHGHVLRTMLS